MSKLFFEYPDEFYTRENAFSEWIVFVPAGAFPWVHPSLELLDEVNDAEIYNAVVSSVKDWQKKQELKKISNRFVLSLSLVGSNTGWTKFTAKRGII